MDAINKLLDSAKETCSARNDAELAALLRVGRSGVSNWRNGRSLPDAVTCDRIAQLTGLPLARVLGIVGEARAVSRDEKSVWRKLSAAAAIAAVAVMMLFAPRPAHATSHNV